MSAISRGLCATFGSRQATSMSWNVESRDAVVMDYFSRKEVAQWCDERRIVRVLVLKAYGRWLRRSCDSSCRMEGVVEKAGTLILGLDV